MPHELKVVRGKSVNANGDTLIDEGLYPVKYQSHSKPWSLRSRWRMTVTVVITKGKHAGLTLETFYSVRDRYGSLPDGRSSRLRRDVIRMLGEPTTDLERLSGLELEAVVKTVRRDIQGQSLSRALQYSKVEILRLRDGYQEDEL